MSVRLRPARIPGGVVMLLGGLIFVGMLSFPLMFWQPSTLGLVAVLLSLLVATGGLFFFLLGLALFSNEIVWTVDSDHVSCKKRVLLKREPWSEPLRNYASLRMRDSIGDAAPAFEILLEHPADPERHVTLYASNSHQEFRERGKQLAAMLKMPLKEARQH